MSKRTRTAAFGAAAAALAAGLGTYPVFFRRQCLTWGARPDEVSRKLPGDELLPRAGIVATRVITIDASPAAIWPARLTAVEDLPASPGSDRRYALRFTSTTTPRECTYGLSRPAFATTQLHLVPGSGCRTWTAVVNRL